MPLATEYRNIFRREGSLTNLEIDPHVREMAYATSLNNGFNAEDTGAIVYFDNAYSAGNYSVSRHFGLTLDNKLNPQHPIGENGIHVRHSTAPTNSDLDLILIDNAPGSRATWPKLWWDHSESSFNFGISGGVTTKLYVNDSLYVNGTQGIGIKTPTSLLEIYKATANPVLTITAAHNTDYDPQIAFRTGASPSIKAAIGVDATDSSFRINVAAAAVVEASTQFKMALTTGYIGLGLPTTTAADNMLHIHKATAGAVDAVAAAHLIIESNSSAYMQFLGPNTVSQGIYFGDADLNSQSLISYNHSTDIMSVAMASTDVLKIKSNGLIYMGAWGATTLDTVAILNIYTNYTGAAIVYPSGTAIGLHGDSSALSFAGVYGSIYSCHSTTSAIQSQIRLGATVIIRANGVSTDSLEIGQYGIGVGGAGYSSSYVAQFVRGGATTTVHIWQAYAAGGGAGVGLVLQQDDQDYAFMDYKGTSAADFTKNISTSGIGGAIHSGFTKIQINEVDQWIPYYTPAD